MSRFLRLCCFLVCSSSSSWRIVVCGLVGLRRIGRPASGPGVELLERLL